MERSIKFRQNWGKAFHVTHSQLVSTNIFFDKLRSLGYPIQQIPYARWHQQLLTIVANNPQHALYPLVSLLSGNSNDSPNSPPDPVAVKLDRGNTLDGLSGTSITCPAIDDRLLDIYFSYIIDHGFITPPLIQKRPQVEQKFLTST